MRYVVSRHSVQLHKAEAVPRAVVQDRKRVAVELVLFIRMVDLPKAIGMVALPAHPLPLFPLVLAGSAELITKEDFIDRTRRDAQVWGVGHDFV